MEFVVYRDSWLRGKRKVTLLNGRKKMCCLGQATHELGVKLDTLRGLDTPERVLKAAPQYRRLMEDAAFVVKCEDPDGKIFWMNSDWCAAAVECNDRDKISDLAREKELTEIFAEAGHSVVFVDGVAPWFEKKGAGDGVCGLPG